ncbi:unnamed protein product [Amaranthus hypochondriacus]
MAKFSLTLLFLFASLVSPILPIKAQDLHKIQFKSPGLYPEGLAYDSTSQRFIVASFLGNKFISVSGSGDTLTLTLNSPEISPNSTILGLAVDHRNHRLLAAINSLSSPFIASFNLNRSSLDLHFLALLSPSIGIANDVAFDDLGNSYVTNSDKNFIYKVTEKGTVEVLSNSSLFRHYPVHESPYSYCGLNGVVYINGFLLVVQSNTGKMFKVNTIDGTATTVDLPLDLKLADGIAVKDDGIVVVVSMNKAWFLKSDDDWVYGVVVDEIALEENGYPTSVVVRDGRRVYVVYGYIQEGITGNSQEREWFRIEEIRMKKETEDGSLLWVVLLVGLGLGYFMFWKFQMGQLVKNMDRKRL